MPTCMTNFVIKVKPYLIKKTDCNGLPRTLNCPLSIGLDLILNDKVYVLFTNPMRARGKSGKS